MVALAAVLGLFPLSVVAGDGDKPAEKKAEKAAKEEKKESKETKERGGNKFVNFWVHDVGGTIGNGLKTGAHKISRAFD